MGNIDAKTKINIIIGDPIEHSLSPGMHNAGYEALGLADQYIYLAAKVDIANLEAALNGFAVSGINGITCTMPHKIQALNYIDELDSAAKEIGAVNTITNIDGILKGYNTDWLGILRPLENKLGNLQGKTLALLGAGGAARAVAYAAKRAGMKLLIFNRTHSSACEIVNVFGGEAYNISELEVIRNADIIVNSTNVGMGEMVGQSLLPIEFMKSSMTVFDIIYQPIKTKLIEDALKVGVQVIAGYEMLLYQGLEQFKIYTGLEASEKVMRQFLENKLGINNAKT